MTALYGGLGTGEASSENFAYADQLFNKIINAAGYGIPPGIYSYAFNPTTGMPFMCDPTKTPPGGVSQVNSAAAMPLSPAKTPPANSPPAATQPLPPGGPYQAEKASDELTENKTLDKVTPDEHTEEQQIPTKSVQMEELVLQKEQRISPIDDMTASMSAGSSTGNGTKDEGREEGQTPTPPGNTPRAPPKVSKNNDQDEDIMSPVSPHTTATGSDANNDVNANENHYNSPEALIGDMTSSVSPEKTKGNDVMHNVDSDGQTPTPPGDHEIESSNMGGDKTTSSLSLRGTQQSQVQMSPNQIGSTSSGSQLGSFNSAKSGSSVGSPDFVNRPKSNSRGNSPKDTLGEKLSGNTLTPLIDNSYDTTKPAATQQKRSNSLTNLIKGKKYMTSKRNTIKIKLPDLPPCPDMKQYHWPWNCLGE